MGFATTLDMKNMLGDDEGVESGNDVTTSPSGIVVETLLNMGTVSALTMEEERFNIFKEALNNSDEHYIRDGFNQVWYDLVFRFLVKGLYESTCYEIFTIFFLHVHIAHYLLL